MYDLSIIIPVYNNFSFTKNAIKDLSKLPASCELVIVDNGSTDKTEEVICSFKNKMNNLRHIKNGKNFGFGMACNQGFQACFGRNVLFLNNDIKVKSRHRTWHEDIIPLMDKGNLVAVEGGLLDKKFNFVKEGKDIDLGNPYSYLSGWFLGGSMRTFFKLAANLNCYRDRETGELNKGPSPGPWNELYELYFEDDDLTFRARKLGIPMKLVDPPIIHYGRMTGRIYNMFGKFPESREKFIKEWKGKIK